MTLLCMYDSFCDLQHWKRQLGITVVNTQGKGADEVCTYHLNMSCLVNHPPQEGLQPGRCLYIFLY